MHLHKIFYALYICDNMHYFRLIKIIVLSKKLPERCTNSLKLIEWIQSNYDFGSWYEKLTSSYCLLAIKEETLTGYGNIISEGNLDFIQMLQ